MAEPEPQAPPTKPPGTREFTIRAVIAGIVVAIIMGASYPYVVLKLGFGPNVSVVAAFFGYMFLGILFRTFNRWENNIVQTAGTSASQTAFMCVILAAFDLVSQNPKLHYSFQPTVFESFVWLAAASFLGVLLAVPLRNHYVVEENLTYADGVAAAETIVVLDARGPEAKVAARSLFVALIISAFVWLLTQKWSGEIIGTSDLLPIATDAVHGAFVHAAHVIPEPILKLFGHADTGAMISLHASPLVPETVLESMFGLTMVGSGAGFSVSLLAVGSGMIVGNRINISMGIGAVIAWIIGPHVLYPGIVDDPSRGKILLWMMWPGTGMLIAGGLTALFLKWRTLKRTFTTLNAKSIDRGEFPIKWVYIGCAAATIALVVIQQAFFGVSWWLSIVAVVLSLPLMLVGLRVLGETNWGPISQLTNMMQALFAAMSPHNLTANLAASGTTGTIAVQSEAIMQDYKAGHIIGSTPRYLTYSQLIAVPFGAAAVALAYPEFKRIYGVGEGGLSAPISRRIAGLSEVLSRGFDALPSYALMFMVIGAIVGILITLGETRWRKYLPSPTGLGIGMMVPGSVVFTMVLGGLLLSAWAKVDKRGADKFAMPLASGLIAGEALMAIIIPIIIAIGWLHA